MVAEWLRGRGYADATVTAVMAFGDDWVGDTNHGFDSKFYTEVEWVDAVGNRRSETVEGEDMESLWKHVVGAWPTEEDR
jgi:hypothetical protein